jgi:chromosome segregation ATPase
VRKLEARLSNSNEKSEILANGMKDISNEISAFIDSINERNSDGRVLINKLDELEKEFEYLKWNFGIVD